MAVEKWNEFKKSKKVNEGEQKVIYKNTLTVEILSEEPLNSDDVKDLEKVSREIKSGDWSGKVDRNTTNLELKGTKAVGAIVNQGSDPEFFGLNDKGEELD